MKRTRRNKEEPVILAGDVGGTKTNLALFSSQGGSLSLLAQAGYPSKRYEGLERIVEKFLRRNPRRVSSAAFGVAGPVSRGRVRTTNLPWIVDAGALGRRLRLPRVDLINDLVANALGIAALGRGDLAVLNRGVSGARGNRVLLSAGTGLGQAHLYWDGSAHLPSPSEGGHADFAPRNPLEAHLWKYLRDRYGHVSWERVLSGPGIYNIYLFLRDTGRAAEPGWLAKEIRKGDPAALISRTALEGRCALCAKTLELFAGIYGAQAGNAALSAWASGGVYLGGGIAPKILPKLKTGVFMKAFLDKGRFSGVLADIPVRVILNDKTALWGAALHAAEPGLRRPVPEEASAA